MTTDLELTPACDNYCVIGNPVAHSLSPAIHAAFARQTGQQIAYRAVQVPVEGFAEAVTTFQRLGGRGANVTLPFKHAAWQIARRRSERAEVAGAVNTLWFNDSGEVCGDNTDGVGLVRDLIVNLGVRLDGRDLLVLGAGGAARGVIPALLAHSPRRLVIANRTVTRGEALAAHFATLGDVEGVGFPGLPGRQFDGIINATSASLNGEVPPLARGVVRTDGWCYDMMYGQGPTAFVRWAREAGAKQAEDGLGMLVEQAAESFLIWRGVRPETGPVMASLRESL
ncbi:MAG: shikimate dehydrogenase [Chromatiales bacterium]